MKKYIFIIVTLLKLILAQDEICLRDYHARSRLPSDQCADGLELNGLLCYPKCKDGFHGVGPVCWESINNGKKNIN